MVNKVYKNYGVAVARSKACYAVNQITKEVIIADSQTEMAQKLGTYRTHISRSIRDKNHVREYLIYGGSING